MDNYIEKIVGVIATIISALGITSFYLKIRQNKKKSNVIIDNNIVHSDKNFGIQNINAQTVNLVPSSSQSQGVNKITDFKSPRSKEDVSILFIDDKNFEVVKLLKKVGWTQTKRIKDLVDLNLYELKNADIVFIDIQGVGKTLFPEEEGFGICREVRKRYPDKFIIIYSAEANHLNNNLKFADKILDKNTNPQAFINILDEYLEGKNENTNIR